MAFTQLISPMALTTIQEQALEGLDLNALDKKNLEIFYKFYDISISNTTCEKLKEYLELTDWDASIMTSLWKLMMPLAVGFLVLYLVNYLITEFASGKKEMNYKDIILSGIKFCLGYFLICYGPDLIGDLATLGNYLLNSVTNMTLVSSGSASGDLEKQKEFAHALYDKCKDLGAFERASINTTLTMISLTSNIPLIGLMLQSISRKMEMILRGGFAGVALANVYDGGMRAGAIRYLKRFLAVSIQGAGIVLVVRIASDLNGTRILDALLEGQHGEFDFPTISTVLYGGLYNFAAVGMVSVIKQIINDMLD